MRVPGQPLTSLQVPSHDIRVARLRLDTGEPVFVEQDCDVTSRTKNRSLLVEIWRIEYLTLAVAISGLGYKQNVSRLSI
jgi:hypothetical protein